MDHFINQIEIRNFKSIRELKLTGFKRINLFIGRPNVGKSNMLEALSLFSLPFVLETSKKIKDILKYEYPFELFYEGIDKELLINVHRINKGLDKILIKFNNSEEVVSILQLKKFYDKKIKMDFTRESNVQIDSSNSKILPFHNFEVVEQRFISKNHEIVSVRGNLPLKSVAIDIKPYRFIGEQKKSKLKSSSLIPPFGFNLVHVLETMTDLRKIYAKWFKAYNLRLVLDTASQTLKVQKDIGDEVFQLPYSSVADTLRRIIFYKTAIASNKNSVLLFEEPEAHAYPPYISEFTQEVIGSETNQTFIVTHSPLIVNDMLDNAIDDLAIFMVDFKDGQTVARSLTHEELHEVRKFGVDLFFNGEAYPV